ncbi:hypothetical protein BS329_36300 [Amycolatopsis coloradensis]|uniref:Uncharacterized protein n=1 Tax=Amycolatopsis coloradensis TaxID=76021 RepID=A0A1R0KG73_9PSEU|nr:hypothetical protein BS329_36300 [Amycolatopsis coloradensis]
MVLAVLACYFSAEQLWQPLLFAVGALLIYLALIRLTRCRVETNKHRPCRWLVRGVVGTCEFHVGYKRGIPVLVRGRGFLGLPTFMWPRDTFDRGALPEQQPSSTARGAAAMSSTADSPGYDWVMMSIAGLSMFVAIAAFIRDLVAG